MIVLSDILVFMKMLLPTLTALSLQLLGCFTLSGPPAGALTPAPLLGPRPPLAPTPASATDSKPPPLRISGYATA